MSDSNPPERPRQLTLKLHPGRLAVCRLEPNQSLPAWLARAEFYAVTRTPQELSLIVPEDWVGRDWKAETGFRALGVVGTLDFSWVGILAELTAALANAEVSVFAISTYDTDYILVRESDLARSRGALEAAGHRVELD